MTSKIWSLRPKIHRNPQRVIIHQMHGDLAK